MVKLSNKKNIGYSFLKQKLISKVIHIQGFRNDKLLSFLQNGKGFAVVSNAIL